MDRSEDRLRAIFKRTDGNCHLCGRKLAFCNYGSSGKKGAWEIEHSVPRCQGGSDRRTNLYAAHIDCNRGKGACSTRSVRTANGLSSAPLSVLKKNQIRTKNRWLWALAGAGTGAWLFGPAGSLVLGIVGLCVGDNIKPAR